MRARVQAFASRCLPQGWVDLARHFTGVASDSPTSNRWLDAFLGAVTAAISAACALAFARARPTAWAWNPATAKSAV